MSTSGYFYVTLCNEEQQRNRFVHRLVATAFIPNEDALPMVDHINRNKLDNRVENLRWCTKSTNSANSRVRPGATSQYRGVRWSKLGKKWTARIHVRGKEIHLGCFADEKQAASAYNVAALNHFGSFAMLNDVVPL
jgi:hypothetical protein